MTRTFLLVLLTAAALAGCGHKEEGRYLGYIEGDFLRLGPREGGMVTGLQVTEGDVVAAGAPLFAIDAERARLAVTQARAQLEAATARAEDLQRGGRPEEVAAAQQQLAQAQADLTLARQNLSRTQELAGDGVASQAQLDSDRRAVQSAEARVAEQQSRLDLVRMPARADQIAAARREADAARAALDLAQQQLDDRTVTAPKAGRIDRIYLREGEYAAPGQPVVSLLPPDNLKAVFFAPEPELSRLSAGQRITLGCDSCAGGITGTVTHVGARAEFAPPVIYSEDARAKLVYRIEARPLEGESWDLNPGQPVEAEPAR